MTLLSRKADYALLILTYLHQHAAGGNAREIAQRFELSRPFVANILKELCHQGFVTSHRGVKGGYALLPTAAGRSLADLLSSIDEEFRLTLCNSSNPHEHCSLESACPVKGPLTEIHRKILEVLQGVTLGELFQGSTLPRITLGLPLLSPPTVANDIESEPTLEPQEAHA